MTPLRLSSLLVLGTALSLATLARAADAPELAGSWTWEWKDGQGTLHHHILNVEGTGTTVAARERFDDLAPVKVDDLKVQDRKVSFSVQRDKRRAVYSGTLDEADVINGKVSVTGEDQSTNQYTWTARRSPAGTK